MSCTMDGEKLRRKSLKSRAYRSKGPLLLHQTTIRQGKSPQRLATAGQPLLHGPVPRLMFAARRRHFLSAKPGGTQGEQGWKLQLFRHQLVICRWTTRPKNQRHLHRHGDYPSRLLLLRMTLILPQAEPAHLLPLSASLDQNPGPGKSQ